MVSPPACPEEVVPTSGHEHPGQPETAEGEARIELVGQASIAVSGEVHRLVTFLNQTLKDENLIFGLTRASDGGSTFSVYRVTGAK